MKNLILSVTLLVTMVTNVFAQSTTPVGLAQGIKGWSVPWVRPVVSPTSFKTSKAQSVELPITYFDASSPINDWVIPSQWGSSVMIGITERMTLPTTTGFVDSVQLTFDQMTGDSIAVVLDPDTVLETPVGFYHLDETIFDLSVQSYAVGVLYPNQLHGQQTVTVVFPHVAVPQNFHVVLVPSNDGVSFTSSFSIRGDNEPVRTRTTDNAHSTFIVVQGTQAFSGVIDRNLTPAGDVTPIFSNLDITAFVQTSNSIVSAQPSSPNSEFAVFPNPVATTLNFNLPADIEASNFELRDLLGRVVLREQGPNLHTIDVSHLGPGRYEAILTTPDGIEATPIIVQR
jgi:hypothetical protein